MAKVKTIKDKNLNGFTLKTHYIPDPNLDDTRRVRVLLPKDYDKNKKASYPVIYMFDGQNLFYDEEAYVGHSWRVSETLNAFPDIPDLIIVGIDNSPARMEEYAPWPMEENPYIDDETRGDGSLARAHAAFIVDTIKPYIDKKYRTLSDKAHTALIGSSLGASMVSYMGLAYQDVFSNLGVFSLANQYFTNGFKASIANETIDPKQKIYIQVGTAEVESSNSSEEQQLSSQQDYVDCSLNYCRSVLEHGLSVENIDMHIYVAEYHNERYWAKHLSDCFRFLSAEWY